MHYYEVKRPMSRALACPKCASPPCVLIEHWTGFSMRFQCDGTHRVEDGYLSEGTPSGRVEAVCGSSSCTHRWTVRGVRQVVDLDVTLVKQGKEGS